MIFLTCLIAVVAVVEGKEGAVTETSTISKKSPYMEKSIKHANAQFKANVLEDHGNSTQEKAQVMTSLDKDLPKFLPTGFHDFVSSNEGTNYNYRRPTNKPNNHETISSYHSNGSLMKDLPEFQSSYTSSNTYPVAEDRLPVDAYRHRGTMPHNAYNSFASWLRYPIPEDRLPPSLSFRYSRKEESDLNKEVQSDNQKSSDKKARLVIQYKDITEPDTSYPFTWDKRSTFDNAYPMDMMMMMSSMQNMINNGDQSNGDSSDNSSGGLMAFLNDPTAIMVAILLPFTMLLAAVLPVLVGVSMVSNGNGNGMIPMVTTTATGGKTLDGQNSTQFLSPIIEAIGTFSPRNDNSECIQKIFCYITKNEKSTARLFQNALTEVSAYVDDFWLDSFGLRTFIQSLKDGKCERIMCHKTRFPISKNTSKSHNEDTK